MSLRTRELLPDSGLHFLKRCYKFINEEWQHTLREPLPDQGFEQRFRESCTNNLPQWSISQEREMHLGLGLSTASGVTHEVDIVARRPELTAIVEMKNRIGYPPEKNDVIVFFAKIFDYLALNPSLILSEACPIFMSNTVFETSGLAACLGLGIHPVAPALRPLPILVDSATRMSNELASGIVIADHLHERFEDFCARLNCLYLSLNDTWISSRCGYQSQNTIVLKAVGGLPTVELSKEFRKLNNDCTELLEEFKAAKSKVTM